MRKATVFVVLLIIGLLCVLAVPAYLCTSQDNYCAVVIYIGYGVLGICGLLIVYFMVVNMKHFCNCLCNFWFLPLCRCCCQICCWRCFLPPRWQSYDNDDRLLYGEPSEDHSARDEFRDEDLALPFSNPEREEGEEWEQGLRESYNQTECAICLESLEGGVQVVRKRCGHKFHLGCINDWVGKNGNCPICRKALA